MTREEAIKFAVHAQSITDIPEVKEFYAFAESAIREQEERENPKPLTLDELRKMDGEPVWDNFLMEWCVIMMDLCSGKGAVKYFDGGFNQLTEKRFYRRKPKEDKP